MGDKDWSPLNHLWRRAPRQDEKESLNREEEEDKQAARIGGGDREARGSAGAGGVDIYSSGEVR